MLAFWLIAEVKGFYELSRLVDLNFTGIVNNVSIGWEPYGMVAAISQTPQSQRVIPCIFWLHEYLK